MDKNKNQFDHSLSTTLLISVIYPLGPAAIILMPMIIGGVIDAFGFSEQQAGAIASLEGMGLVIASAAAAFWIRKICWTKILFIGLILTALLNVISAHQSEYSSFLVLRFLAGLTGGTIFAVTVAALGDNREPDRAFGIAQAVQGIMMFAAFTVAPYMIQAWEVKGLFYMLATAYIVLLLCLYKFPSQGMDHTQAKELVGTHNSTFLIWLGLLASFIFFINIFGFWAFIERIGQAADIPLKTIGLALGASQIIAVGGAIGAALASDRFGRRLPLIIVLAGQSLVLWLLIGRFSSITFFIGAGTFQALFMVGVAYQMGAIAKIDFQGKFLVIMTAAQGLGAALGPSIAATLISEGRDYGNINLMAASCCLVSILLFLYIIQRSRNIAELI